MFLENGLSLLELTDDAQLASLYDVPSILAFAKIPKATKLVQVIGEALTSTMISNLPDNVTLWNWYGPTEVSISSTMKPDVTA